MRLTSRTRLLSGAALSLALVATACGGGDDTGSSAGADGAGNIDISGSSTVEPISNAVKEKFNEDNPDVAISVSGPGTGDGFEAFCAGETDISNASRAIKDEEAQACADAGIEYTELLIGIDGLAVLTNPGNDAVECLDFAAIYGLVGPESIGFGTWADGQAIADELGTETELPDAPLTVIGPGEESGTYDTFVELTLEDFADERGEPAETRPDYEASANDNVIVEGITGNDTPLGWVGYAFYLEEQDSLKALEVNDGESGCVAPTDETIASGEYPLSRELYIYVNDEAYGSKPDLAAFVDFYVSDEGLASVSEVGYVELGDEALAELRDAAEGLAG